LEPVPLRGKDGYVLDATGNIATGKRADGKPYRAIDVLTEHPWLARIPGVPTEMFEWSRLGQMGPEAK